MLYKIAPIAENNVFQQHSVFRTWSNEMGSKYFCQDESQACLTPNFPKCQDRTISCLDPLPLPSGTESNLGYR